jgi:hypothetical protein
MRYKEFPLLALARMISAPTWGFGRRCRTRRAARLVARRGVGYVAARVRALPRWAIILVARRRTFTIVQTRRVVVTLLVLLARWLGSYAIAALIRRLGVGVRWVGVSRWRIVARARRAVAAIRWAFATVRRACPVSGARRP